MKKFLKLELPAAEKEIPAALDARILASAGIKARSLRRKKLLVKVTLPAVVTTSAAAAAAVMILMPATVTVSQPQTRNTGATTIAAVSVTPRGTRTPQTAVSSQDMLALADVTALEQECYNLANIAEFSLDGDNFSM